MAAKHVRKGLIELETEKTSGVEVCTRCATASRSVYDRRWVTLKDEPIRRMLVRLRVRKRRFWCKPCGRAFTEPLLGVSKGARTTARYRKRVLSACERYADLTSVQRDLRCSAGYLYKALYTELELKQRTRQYPWPEVIGIDEHFFRRDRAYRAFATVIVDMKGKRVFEVAEGTRGSELEAQLEHIDGRDNVRWVVLDLADSYKSFCKRFFPKAEMVADKFHVLRLLNPAINRVRKAITGDRRSLPIRRWLLTSGKRLNREKRWRLLTWLNQHPDLNALYHAKESLHGFYRIRGHKRAKRAMTKICDALALSDIPQLLSLRRTLIRWRREILNYFRRRLTNGRTEGFNGKAKLVKRRTYGFRSFRNYRLRLLNACA